MANILRKIKFLWFAIVVVFVLTGAAYGEEVLSPDTIKQKLLPTEAAGEASIKTMGINGKRHKNPIIHIQIPFELNQYLISPKAVPYLQALGKALSDDALKGYVFEIQGHTCNLGSDDHNKRLSQKRAESVKEYLISYFNLSSDQLHDIGYGKNHPIADNRTDQGRSKNRRVTVLNTLEPFQDTSNRVFLKTEVKYLRGKEVLDLFDGQTLTSRDNYSISFIPDQTCHVYVFQKDSHGKMTTLFPNPEFSEKSNPVSAAELYRLPGNDWLYLDENKGKEEIIALASPEALSEPEKICQTILEDQAEHPSLPQDSSDKEENNPKKAVHTMGPKGIRAGHANTSPSSVGTEKISLFTWRFHFNHQ